MRWGRGALALLVLACNTYQFSTPVAVSDANRLTGASPAAPGDLPADPNKPDAAHLPGSANAPANANVPGDGNLPANANLPTGGDSPFVTAKGSAFFRAGQPLVLKGFQASLPGLTSCAFTADEFTQSLADMVQQAGANTVRLWFLQAAGGPGNWAAFDAAVAAAKAQNLLIVATLVNEWGDCEPTVAGAKNLKTLTWYQSGYQVAGDGYPLSFRAYAQAVAARYQNEPTIALWQLVNEAQAAAADGSCPANAASVLRAFADDMAQVMHAADAHHLVNLGTAADNSGHCGTIGEDFTTIHQGAIDVCEVHSYDPPTGDFPTILAGHIAQALALNKPIFLGEIGICRNVSSSGQCSGDTSPTSLAQRATYMNSRLTAGLAAGLAGALIWQWSPASGQFLDTLYGMGPADPYLATMKTSF